MIDPLFKQSTSLVCEGNLFSFAFVLDEPSFQRRLHVVDTFGVAASSPFPFQVEAIEDQIPIVKANVVGIGSAITPVARIPIQGQIIDDYGVQNSWIDLEIGVPNLVFQLSAPTNSNGEIDTFIDLREFNAQNPETNISPESTPTISLLVHATDYFLKNDQPQQG